MTLPPGDIRLVRHANDWRRLDPDGDNRCLGIKRVLVVRVTDKDGRAVVEDASYVSDKFFGTRGDTATAQSGLAACSFGQFAMTNDYGGAVKEDILAAPGVLDVTLEVRLSDTTQEDLLRLARLAVERQLDVALPGPFEHVALVLEECYAERDSYCGYSAYAYVNHWISVYFADYYKCPTVAMHELGHNLNFAHSGGRDSLTYTDRSGLMGNPRFADGRAKLCYNPVKNYRQELPDGARGHATGTYVPWER